MYKLELIQCQWLCVLLCASILLKIEGATLTTFTRLHLRP